MSRLVSVAVPVPFLQPLTYRVPDALPMPVPGARVLVPLGTRRITGCVLGAPVAGPTVHPIKDILDVFDAEPMLPAEVLALTQWVAEYYACGPGEAVAAAVPPHAWVESERQVQITDRGRVAADRGAAKGPGGAVLAALRTGRAVGIDRLASALGPRAGGTRPSGFHALVSSLERDGLVTVTQPLRGRQSAFKSVRVVRLTAQGHELSVPFPRLRGEGQRERSGSEVAAGPTPAPDRRLGGRQREALEALAGAPEGLDAAALIARHISGETLRRLRDRGLVSFDRRTVDRDPFEPVSVADGLGDMPSTLALTLEQRRAVEVLERCAQEGAFRAALLHGVTGSGKTEIYLRLARTIRASGRSVLVLVPEIALTPAVAEAFRGQFGDAVAIQHSGLSDGERHDQWHRIRRGGVDIVVGTRSAVFAPLANLGLIVVDEEHDAAYKQEESPRYHARDVAVVRAQRVRALVVLGSATPSMESFQNAVRDRYVRVTLGQRVMDRPLASVEIVDMREEYAARGPDVVFSTRLHERLTACLARQDQALILLNRRGFAAVVFCRQCGGTLECPNCSVSLTYHRAAGRSQCHYCNYSIAQPRVCPACGGPFLEQIGFGTERVEAELAALVPGARVARLDSDTVRRRGAIVSLLDRFRRGDLDVLVGTQMIAKGHDFPRVTLVGVISADVGLGLADFRAAERTFQLLTQVAGRAGRGEAPGEAIVQTIYPHHYSVRYGCRQQFVPFFEEELKFRQGMRYPPVVSLINAVVRARTLAAAMGDAAGLVGRLRTRSAPYRVLGPAPAPLSRLRGEYRAQFFLKGTHRAAMRQALQRALEAAPHLKRRVTVDVDPLSVL